jgi:ABC-type nitrate/sulfonate/bicarbonate transport system substrate-binding protein
MSLGLSACSASLSPAGSSLPGSTPATIPTVAPSGAPASPAASAPATSAPATSAPATAGPTPAGPPSPVPTPTPPTAAVRLALDWTPNTNHSGFYVAQARGWYGEAAIDLKLLPYTSATPETLLAAGQAECGISFQDSLTFAVAAGAPITSVMAILQHSASAIAVLDSGDIRSPRDLDGKTYGGFGYPADDPTIKVVIKHDGGKGVFKDVTLNASAYEALYAKQVDFTIVFTGWEGIEAQERGIALRYFRAIDYGFPDYYQVVLACNTDWLKANPDVARRFLAATVRGFELAQAYPDEAAASLVAQNPGLFDTSPKLPLESARYMSSQHYYLDAQGRVGPQTLEQWTAYSGFLYREGLLADVNGKPLVAPPDYSTLFTNDYLPTGP